MFRSLGQTTIPEQVPGIINYVTLASADCSRVMTEEIDIMRVHARSPNLTPEQSAQLLQLISDNYAKCGGTSGGGAPTITPGGPPIQQSSATPDFFGGIGSIGILAAIAVVGLLLLKR